MIYSSIRQDIVNGNFDRAFTALYSIVLDHERSNELSLIEFRIKDLKKRVHTEEETYMIERNKTVYSLLMMVSELESTLSVNQRAAMKALEMTKVEDLLTKGYGKLMELQGGNPVYAFFSWLNHSYPASLQMLSKNGRIEGDQVVAMLNIDLAGFMAHYKIDKPYDQVYRFLHDKLSSDPTIFMNWKQQTELVRKTISNLERSYKMVLAGIGISLGGVLLGLFISDIDDKDVFEIDDLDDDDQT